MAVVFQTLAAYGEDKGGLLPDLMGLSPFWGSRDHFEVLLGSGGTLEHQRATKRPQQSIQEANK